MIATLGVVALPNLSHLLATALFSLPYSYSSTVVALYLVYLLLSAGLTALTVHLVHKYFGAGGIPPLSLKVERVKMSARKGVPIGLMALVGAYWGLYLVPQAILPGCWYLQAWHTPPAAPPPGSWAVHSAFPHPLPAVLSRSVPLRCGRPDL